jgi:hypothetical protein
MYPPRYRADVAEARSGYIQQLPSGAFRVSVYAGTDPLTGRQIRLRRTCKTERAAEIELGKLLEQAADGRRPDSRVTVADAAQHGLPVAALRRALEELATEGVIAARQGRRAVVAGGPGPVPVPRPRAEDTSHDCTRAGCQPHRCRPMSGRTIRQIHAILSGAHSGDRRRHRRRARRTQAAPPGSPG